MQVCACAYMYIIYAYAQTCIYIHTSLEFISTLLFFLFLYTVSWRNKRYYHYVSKDVCFILCSVLLTSWRNIRLLHHIRTYNTKKDPIWTASLCIPLRGHSTLWKLNWEMNEKLKKINLSFLFAFYLILKENFIRSTFNHNCYFDRSNYNLFSSIFNILNNAQ